MSKKPRDLTSGRRLARNVLWNLFGNGAPLLVAFFAIPVLIGAMGTTRFGVLTIAWMVVGYFSLFDMGLGRALTKLIADRLGTGQEDELPGLIWTAMLLITSLGLLAAIIVAILSPWLVGVALKMPSELHPESLTAFYILAASIPIVIGATGLRGILEAHQRFDLINAVRIPLGIFTFLGPVAVLPFSNSLVPATAVLIVARLISWFSYLILCLHVDSSLRQPAHLNGTMVKPLIHFGGWLTITNIVGPIMAYMDRFLIGTMISMSAVAYYATPSEVVSRLRIVPGALMGVLFPAFATTLVQDRARTAQLFDRALRYILLSLFPVFLIIVTLAHEGLTLWVGSEYAANSTLVLQLLAVGVFINSHATAPFGLLQSAGRPDLTAKLHLVELPFYLLILWWLVGVYGIVGAAVAWVVRVVVDTILLLVVAHRLLREVARDIPQMVLRTSISVFVLALGSMIPGIFLKLLFLVGVLCLFAVAGWFLILVPDERELIRSRLKKALVRHI